MKVKFMKTEGFLLFDDILSIETELYRENFLCNEGSVLWPTLKNEITKSECFIITMVHESGKIISVPTEWTVYILNDQGNTIETIDWRSKPKDLDE